MCVDYALKMSEGYLEYVEPPAYLRKILDTGTPDEIELALIEYRKARQAQMLDELLQTEKAALIDD